MAKIALRTEEALDYAAIFKGKGISDKIHSTEAISHATVQIAQELDADAAGASGNIAAYGKLTGTYTK